MRWFLLPVSWLYGFATGLRNFLYDFKVLHSIEFNIPVISIGNITVGGTGKTPHVEYLADLFKRRFKVAVLSRGYKRKSRGFRFVTTDSSCIEAGDEPKQIKQKLPEIIVAVDRNRVNGINKLINNNSGDSPDIIVLDDAFQHRRVKPAVNILLIDFNRPLADRFLLPVGTLRESVHNRSRANIIIISKAPEKLKPIEQRIILNQIAPFPYQPLFFSTIVYGEPLPVFPGNVPEISTELIRKNNTSVLVITGIAHPAPFIEYLKSISAQIEHIKFRDHYKYKKSDITDIEKKYNSLEEKNKLIITTEKDAVRLQENIYLSQEIKMNLFYIPIKVKFLSDNNKSFDKQIIDYVARSTENSFFHKEKS
ncbi:MAG: tetraacyldisaccharide 4'-kinase [Bacteroidia bacterium]|nr:tetraacyldisaccharide 4'-kinase [Bacteroidia bacterium]